MNYLKYWSRISFEHSISDSTAGTIKFSFLPFCSLKGNENFIYFSSAESPEWDSDDYPIISDSTAETIKFSFLPFCSLKGNENFIYFSSAESPAWDSVDYPTISDNISEIIKSFY